MWFHLWVCFNYGTEKNEWLERRTPEKTYLSCIVLLMKNHVLLASFWYLERKREQAFSLVVKMLLKVFTSDSSFLLVQVLRDGSTNPTRLGSCQPCFELGWHYRLVNFSPSWWSFQAVREWSGRWECSLISSLPLK